jgi:hypothetical protein
LGYVEKLDARHAQGVTRVRELPRLAGAFNLGGGDAHPISIDQHLIAGDRLPIDANEIIFGLGLGTHLPSKQFFDGRAMRQLEIVGEASAIIVNDQDFHGLVAPWEGCGN